MNQQLSIIPMGLTHNVLSYFGGKFRLASKMLPYIPEHDRYVEPYAGGFGLGLAKSPSKEEIATDLHHIVINFWQALASRPGDLVRRVKALQYSLDSFPMPKLSDATGDGSEASRLDLAARLFLYTRQARNGWAGLKNDAGCSDRKLEGLRGRDFTQLLWQGHYRVKDVRFLLQDAFATIQQFDGNKTLFLVDPPYLHEVRGAKDSRQVNPVISRRQYGVELFTITNNSEKNRASDEQAHVNIATVLHRVSGKVMLTHPACPLYEELYPHWRRVDLLVQNGAGKKVGDTLWMNY